MFNFTQIKETCIYVKDLDKTEHFYSQILKLPVIGKDPDRHIFFRAGSSVLLCFIADKTRHDQQLPPHYAEGKQHLAFEVAKSDYESSKQKILDNNIIITHEQSWGHHLQSFYFEDPDGNVLEIVPEGMWG